MQAVRRMLEAGILIGPHPFLAEGDHVTVERGPLSGVEGLIVQVKAGFRLVVSIHLLQRSVFAEIDRDWVVPNNRPANNVTYAGSSK